MATKTTALSVKRAGAQSMIKSPRRPAAAKAGKKAAAPDAFDRRAKIAEMAYFLAEKRGFAPGGELDDWFKAESIFSSGEGN